MALTREQKEKSLKALKEKIARQKAMFFVDFSGLKVKDMSILRKKIKTAGAEFKAAKKTLINIAFKEAKIDIETKKMPGELALVLAYQDEISPAKLIWQFSIENQNLKILGGFFENKLVGAQQIIALAQLPSKEELLARLVGSFRAPVAKFVYALNYNIKGLIFILANIKK